jgi:hypothetical protein
LSEAFSYRCRPSGQCLDDVVAVVQGGLEGGRVLFVFSDASADAESVRESSRTLRLVERCTAEAAAGIEPAFKVLQTSA